MRKDRLTLVPKLELSWRDVKERLEGIGAEQVDSVGDDLQTWKADGSTIHLIEDGLLSVRYFLVDGEQREAVAKKIEEAIPVYKPSDMPAFLDDSMDADGYLHRLGVVAGVAPDDVDPDIVKAFELGYAHADPMVRERAVLLATGPRWPELRAGIERLARDDEDENVRESARVALDDFDEPK